MCEGGDGMVGIGGFFVEKELEETDPDEAFREVHSRTGLIDGS
jgi:hypothetical protein